MPVARWILVFAGCVACGDGGATGGSGSGGSTSDADTASASDPTADGSSSSTGAVQGTGPCALVDDGWSVEAIPVTVGVDAVRLGFDGATPAIAWIGGTNQFEQLYYGWPSGGAWTHEEIRGSSPGMGVPGLAFDGDGVAHLLYGWQHSLGGAMAMATRGGDGWTEIDLVADRAAQHSSLLRLPDGTLLGLFHQLWQLESVTPDGSGGWTQAIVDDGTMGGGMASAGVGNDLAIGIDGAVLASYADATNTLYLARRDGTAWAREAVASGVDLEATALAVDAGGGVHIAYRHELDQALMLASRTAATWEIASIDGGRDDGRAAQLEIDADGVRHLAHFRNDDAAIRYANDRDGAFVPATIAARVSFGALALGLDDQGRARLVWATDEHLCLALAE